MVTLLAPVQAPPAAPPRVGLIASAILPNNAGERWQNGFSYESESCFEGGRVDPCAQTNKTIEAGSENPQWEPYGVWGGQKCSTLGFNARDWQARARRILQAVEHFQIEQELWTGDTATAAGFPNRFLASPDSDVLTSSPADYTDALACLEQYLAQTNSGQRGMIHATRQIVTQWAALNLVKRDGNLLTTINDTLVVPGSGYDGSDQNGNPATAGNVWAYATGMVEVRRDDQVDLVGGPNSEGVNRDTNTIEIRAERLAVASWDGCAHGAVQIDADPCAFGGLGS